MWPLDLTSSIAMQLAFQEAQRCNRGAVIPTDILIGLLKCSRGCVPSFLDQHGVKLRSVRKLAEVQDELIAAIRATALQTATDEPVIVGK